MIVTETDVKATRCVWESHRYLSDLDEDYAVVKTDPIPVDPRDHRAGHREPACGVVAW